MSHTFYLYQKDWENVKPEYFAMLEDGTRAPRPIDAVGADFSLTNPEVRDRIYAQLLKYIEQDRKEAAEKGFPAPTMYALSQNDTASKYCRSPEAKAIAEREGSQSGVMIEFINDIAARIAKTHPEIKLVTEAYTYSKHAPKFIRPRENVIIRLALLDREYRNDEMADVLRPITASTNRESREITEAWAAAISGGQMFIWDYAMTYRAPFRHPYDTTSKVLSNLEFWHKLGIRRVFLECSAVDVSFGQMRDWLFFQKSLNPQADSGKLVEEFLSGYFGPAAGPMGKYYSLLASSTVAGEKPYFEIPPSASPYLTAGFIQKSNTWLDEAEALCAAEKDAKYLRNVRYERIPLDSVLLHVWSRYASDPAFAGKKEEILQRYERNKRNFIETWSTSVHHVVNFGRDDFSSELASLRVEPPKEFAGRNASIRMMGQTLPGMSRVDYVKDPAAAGGTAQKLGSGKPEDHKLPFLARVHDGVANQSWQMLQLNEVPQDEAYHWHHLGSVPLTAGAGIWSNVYTWIPLGWAALPPPANELDVYISLKFTGPTYVKGSTQPDQVLIDRVLVALPAGAGNEKRP